MAYRTCEDCGTRLSGDICPNCEEELYIYETQAADIDFPLSEEFSEQVREQRKKVDRRTT